MKKTMLPMLLAGLVVSISGCGNGDVQPSPSPTLTPTPTATVAVSPTPDAASQATAAPTKSPVTTNTPKPAVNKTATGVYNGREDSNFIELSMPDGTYRTCRLSADLKENFKALGLNEGDTITFEYTEADGQYTIMSISK